MTAPDPLTICLAVYDGIGARYLLRTDVIPELLAADARVVVLSPNADEHYFRNEMLRCGVTLVTWDLDALTERFDRSRVERSLKVLRAFALDPSVDLSTIEAFFEAFQAEREGHRVALTAVRAAVALLRRSRLLRRALVGLEARLFVDRTHEHVFREHGPDVLVTTTMGHTIYDAYVMRLARQWNTKLLTAVLSWDNTSKWGIGGIRPDRVTVWSDTQRQEVVCGHDMPPERVRVVGVPHFDRYTRSPLLSRNDFFRRHELDPDRAVIWFGTKAPQNFASNAYVARLICRAILDGRLSRPSQLLVRLHPQYFRAGSGRFTEEELNTMLGEFEAIRIWCPFIRVNRPSILSARLDLDMPSSEMDDLHAMLAYSDVLVNPFSTLNVEACLFDLPTVNCALEDPQGVSVGHVSRRSIEIDEAHAHNRRILRHGFTRVAHRPVELIEAIDIYLRDPSRDREARRRVAEQECGLFDGAAGKRLACEILTLAGRGQRAHSVRHTRMTAHPDYTVAPRTPATELRGEGRCR